MRIEVLSLFPEYFQGPFSETMIKQAQEKGLIEINLVDIRSYSTDKFRRVDDRPYGGGPGMVMMADPVVACVKDRTRPGAKVVYLSPQGAPLTHAKCRELAGCNHLVLLCGHYEGIDERAIDAVVDEEIRVGDFVLTNGCLAACVLVDAVSRFVPGVLGDAQACEQDSFEGGLLDWPHYTRPFEFEGVMVPDVLLSGNHEAINVWRQKEAHRRTKERRFDLYLNWLENHSQAVETAISSKSMCLESIAIKTSASEESRRFYKKLFVGVDLRHIAIADECAVHISLELDEYVMFKRRVKKLTKLISAEAVAEERFSFRDPDSNIWVVSLRKG